MSLDNFQNNFVNTLDGLASLDVDVININGVNFDPSNYVKYSGNTQALDMGSNAVKTSYAASSTNDVVNLGLLQSAIGSQDSINALNFLSKVATSAQTMNSSVDFQSNKITSSAVPSGANDLTNKNYVDTVTSGLVPYTGATSTLNMGSNLVRSSAVPIAGQDLCNKTYVDGRDATKVSIVGDTMTGDLYMGSNYVLMNAVPTLDNQGVNKKYVDIAIAGLGAGILNLNNTWTGTNTFNNTLTQSLGNYGYDFQGIHTLTKIGDTIDYTSISASTGASVSYGGGVGTATWTAWPSMYLTVTLPASLVNTVVNFKWTLRTDGNKSGLPTFQLYSGGSGGSGTLVYTSGLISLGTYAEVSTTFTPTSTTLEFKITGINGFMTNIQWTRLLIYRSVITMDANVGIGTTAPVAKLSVYDWAHFGDATDPSKYGMVQITRPSAPGDNKFHISFIRSGMRASGIGYVNNSSTIGWVNNNDIAQTTYGIYLTDGGNVGIRTSTPRQVLDVNGSIVTNWDNRWLGVQYSDGSEYFLGMRTNANARVLEIGARTADSTGTITFVTGTNERMRITSSGGVGIKLTTPYYLLHPSNTSGWSTSGNKATGIIGVAGGNDNPNEQRIVFPNPSIGDNTIPGMYWWSPDFYIERYKNEFALGFKECHGAPLGSAYKDILRAYVADAGGYQNLTQITLAGFTYISGAKYNNYFNNGGGAYAYLSWNGVSYPTYGYLATGFSLQCVGSILADTYVAFSDKRVKRHIKERTPALADIAKLQFYEYDNRIGIIDRKEYGVLANDIKEVFPHMVSETKGWCPNIKQYATHQLIDSGNVRILLETPDEDVKVGDKVRLHVFSAKKKREAPVLEQKVDENAPHGFESQEECVILKVDDLTVFEVAKWDTYDPEDGVYVYGTHKDDILALDKIQLAMVALQGVQELMEENNKQHKQIKRLTVCIDEHEKQIKLLTDRNVILEQHARQIETEFNEYKRQSLLAQEKTDAKIEKLASLVASIMR